VRKKKLEKPKPAEAIFSYSFSASGIIDIDQHILIWNPCEIAGEDFDKAFFLTVVSLLKTFSHIKSVRPMTAVETQPKIQALGTNLIQPLLVLLDLRIVLLYDFLLFDGLRDGE